MAEAGGRGYACVGVAGVGWERLDDWGVAGC